MTESDLQRELESILSEAKTAVYATSGEDGTPQLRWVTPAFLHGHPGRIYFVSAPQTQKVTQTRRSGSASWLFQTPSLDRIVQVHGVATVLQNAALASEVLEAVGPRLSVFWRITPDQHRLVVIETRMDSAVVFRPMTGSSETWGREGGAGGTKKRKR